MKEKTASTIVSKERDKILFVVNPLSGTRNKSTLLKLIENEMQLSNIEFDIIVTEYAGHAISLAKEAVENNYSCVVAVGGDGTVNEVGQSLVNTNTALGIVPCGSGNGLARHLNISMQTKRSIKTIITGKQKLIDTATINNKVFLGMAGIGFDAHVGWKFAQFGRRGLLTYMQISTFEFFNYRPNKYELEIDGEKMDSNAFLISFANTGQFGNNAWIAPEAKIDDGMLNVCILEKFPLMDLADIIYRLFSKKLTGSKHYKFIQAKEIKVKKGHNYLHMDGEADKMEEELLIKVIPSSLNVIC